MRKKIRSPNSEGNLVIFAKKKKKRGIFIRVSKVREISVILEITEEVVVIVKNLRRG